MGAERLNDLVYMHYNMRLRLKQVHGEDQGYMKDDPNPVDLSIYVHSSDDDPITEWLKDNGSSVLNDERGQLDSEIA
ncbi:hypothetical protein [Vibrio parahaemolyticus]|uniref:hypothetical protein n=1 Tax=Vibrio parahaemolyticus TaxID=670 RepID=UPI0029FAC4BF|nr:hypothetical protein [Vibrio parahaemolyticus]MCX8910871.1 hypothetical protein [Vibrio parahaemolyticus]